MIVVVKGGRDGGGESKEFKYVDMRKRGRMSRWKNVEVEECQGGRMSRWKIVEAEEDCRGARLSRWKNVEE